MALDRHEAVRYIEFVDEAMSQPERKTRMTHNIVHSYRNAFGHDEAISLDKAGEQWSVTLLRKTRSQWGPAPMSACNRRYFDTDAAAQVYVDAWKAQHKFFALAPLARLLGE